MNNQNYNVAAAPNKSKIQGKIEKIERDRETEALVLQVKVEQSDDVAGMPNFTKSRIGKLAKIYLPSGDKKKVKKGECVEFLVSYQGDEAGGIFFVVEDELQSK